LNYLNNSYGYRSNIKIQVLVLYNDTIESKKALITATIKMRQLSLFNISQKILNTFQITLRDLQLDAITYLHEGENIILTALTGWGKSIIFQAIIRLYLQKITIIISLLVVLQEEHVSKMK